MAEQTKSTALFKDGTLTIKPDEYVHVLREIVTTEETFVNLIEGLIEDFLKPLASVMTSEEKKSTNINFNALHDLHATFHSKLFDAWYAFK